MNPSDNEKEPAAHPDASLPLRPITSSRSRPPPGVNNRLPYSAKSWHRSVGVNIFHHLPQTAAQHVPSKRPREPTPPPHNDDADGEEDGSSGSTTTPPATLEDLLAILTELWGYDVRRWLPAALPYPPALMSLSALQKWPSGVAAALAELARLVGDDAEAREEALRHVATAVAVRRSMAGSMKTGGKWVARTDVEYAAARMSGDEERGFPAAAAAAPPQYRSEGRRSGSGGGGFERARELIWVNNNWEGNLNPGRPEKRRKHHDPELGSDSEIPAGVEFDSFRLEKRNAALKRRVAALKEELGDARREADAERVRREAAESFVGATRTSMSKFLGEPKMVDPEKFISDTRNSMTSYLAEARKR